MLADFDPAVTAVAAQPFRLIGAGWLAGAPACARRLAGRADGGVTVVDVKAPGKRADPEVRAVMEWTRQVAALRGWAFEEWYGAPPRLLENVRFLAGYRRRAVIDEQLIPAVLEAAGGPRRSRTSSGVSAAPTGAGPAGGHAPAVVRRPGHRHGPAAGRGQRDLAAGGSGSVTGTSVIGPGSRLSFDGEVVEVSGFEGTRVTLRDGRDRWRTLGLAGFLARRRSGGGAGGPGRPVGPLLAGLSGGEQSVVTERAGHVREVLTGYRSGQRRRPGRASRARTTTRPGRSAAGRRPRPASLAWRAGRSAAGCAPTGTAGRPGWWMPAGSAADGSALDPRWEEACRTVVAGQVGASTPTAGALLRLIDAQLDDQHGAGACRGRQRRAPTGTWPG